jgi:hypothetical protein
MRKIRRRGGLKILSDFFCPGPSNGPKILSDFFCPGPSNRIQTFTQLEYLILIHDFWSDRSNRERQCYRISRRLEGAIDSTGGAQGQSYWRQT